MANKKFLALTLGDPCGIGPEIVVKAFGSFPRNVQEQLVIIGPRKLLVETFKEFEIPIPLWTSSDLSDKSSVRFIDISGSKKFPPGKVCKAGGEAAIEAIRIAHELCRDGVCKGMVTGPIGKKAISLAGSPFSGHTDMLEAMNECCETRMAMVWQRFKVVMTTLHVSIAQVPSLISKKRVLRTLHLAHQAFASSRKPAPFVGVAGLNPHAGEGGLFGDEEQNAIIPAIKQFQKINRNVFGPFPADSLFKADMRKKFDYFIAQTHDQGLIAIKALGGLACVNVTLGLPYIRTSVGHGTAYDIAGKGIADHSGLVQAVKLARKLA